MCSFLFRSVGSVYGDQAVYCTPYHTWLLAIVIKLNFQLNSSKRLKNSKLYGHMKLKKTIGVAVASHCLKWKTDLLFHSGRYPVLVFHNFFSSSLLLDAQCAESGVRSKQKVKCCCFCCWWKMHPICICLEKYIRTLMSRNWFMIVLG